MQIIKHITYSLIYIAQLKIKHESKRPYFNVYYSIWAQATDNEPAHLNDTHTHTHTPQNHCNRLNMDVIARLAAPRLPNTRSRTMLISHFRAAPARRPSWFLSSLLAASRAETPETAAGRGTGSFNWKRAAQRSAISVTYSARRAEFGWTWSDVWPGPVSIFSPITTSRFWLSLPEHRV